MNKSEMAAEALNRATSGESWSNYPAIFSGFQAKGIPESEIKPRENVFTYQAWRALGRQVRKGEHGVRVETVVQKEIEMQNEDGARTFYEKKMISFPRSTTVFHVSQTDAMKGSSWKTPQATVSQPSLFEPTLADQWRKAELAEQALKAKINEPKPELSDEDADAEYRKLFPSQGGAL